MTRTSPIPGWPCQRSFRPWASSSAGKKWSSVVSFCLLLISANGARLVFGDAAPQAPEGKAFGRCREIEERLAQYLVVGPPRGAKGCVAFVGEHCEPLASVCRVHLAANQPVAFETGDKMARTGRAEQDPLGQRRHREPP